MSSHYEEQVYREATLQNHNLFFCFTVVPSGASLEDMSREYHLESKLLRLHEGARAAQEPCMIPQVL